MRVLVTHERFLPEFSGGCEYGVYSLARGLLSRGVEVDVLTTGDPLIREYDAIRTRRLPVHRYRMNLAVREIMASAREADLIQTANYHASLPSFLAAKRLNKPIVLLVTALCGEAWLRMRGAVFGRAYAAWERYLMRQPFSRIVFPSEHSRQLGIRMGIPESRCIVISPGIELHKFAPASEKENVVLFVGKFEQRKGIFKVVEVARALPEVRFRLIGWGPGVDLIRKVASPNMEIIEQAPGAVIQDSSEGPLQRAFGKSSIFFLPSEAESFGLVIAEAMASGCAIVSSVPLDYEGIRVAWDDVPAMIEAIRTLWSDREKAAQMGRRNVELARYYNWDRFTASLLAVYEEVLAESAQAKERAVAQLT